MQKFNDKYYKSKVDQNTFRNEEYCNQYQQKNYLYSKEDNELENSIYLELVNWLKREKMRFTLCMVREILLVEGRRGYYRNALNIQEIIDLEQGIFVDDDGVEYTTINRMQFYYNENCEFCTFLYPKKKIKELKKEID